MSSEVIKNEDMSSEEWPEKEFLETALRNWQADPTLKVTEFKSKLATKKGDNYTSEVFRITAKCKQRNDPVNIVAKRLSTLGSSGDSFSKSSAVVREEEMFSSVLPEMHKVLKKVMPEVEPFGAYYIYSTPTVLMLEDLQPGGFRMAPRRAFLDLKTCSLVLRTLARFHAASVLLIERESVDLSAFRKCIYAEPNKVMDNFFNGMLTTLSAELKNMKGLEKYASKVSAFNSQSFRKRLHHTVEDNEEGDFLVISHGDFWVNNILFRYSTSGEVNGIRMVDFQFSSISSPCIDLQYFLSSSCDEIVRTTRTDQLLEEYHETLCNTMAALKCSTRPPSIEKLRIDFDKRTHFGMFAAFTIIPLILSEDGQLDLSEIADGILPTGELFRSEPLKKALEWFLPRFETKGYL